MITIKLCAFLLLFSLPIISQTPISGTINQYANVVAIDPCEAKLTLSAATFFNPGDHVLIFQIQGATINESNSSSFGNVTNIGSSGLFERNEILSKSGNDLFLKFSLENNYDPSGAVQLVSVPQFEDAVVTETLTALPWNGLMGGVVALEVTGTLTLEADIDVTGQGFRGGVVNALTSDCNFLTNASGYYYSMTNWRGAPKGEGIAAPISGKEQGRGAQANGGGGGNDHNSGGGGGANVTLAGEGGRQSVGGLGCDGDYPGERGKAVPTDSTRIFFGGGGGAGHADNVGAGSDGGNGGGIVILLGGTLAANGHKIVSNGNTPSNGAGTGDGQGGGGAGGTILLGMVEVEGQLFIEAKGGNGGNASNPSNRCFGPGGGGSGGRLVSGLSNFAGLDLSGGQPGVNLTPSSQCSNDPSNSADAGENGLLTAFGGVPASTQTIEETAILQQPMAKIACVGQQVTFEFLMQGQGLDYVWQVNDGSGWQNVQPSANVTGILTNSLTFSAVQANMDSWQFRCFVTGPCTIDILSLPALLTVPPAALANFTYQNQGGGVVLFDNLSQNATSYLWDFGDGSTSTDANPEHTYADFGNYTVTLTIASACGEITLEQQINVIAPPSAGFSVDSATGCAPLSVQFFNESSVNAESWEWHFPGGVPSISFDEEPSVLYQIPGNYPVTLIVSNADGADTLTLSAAIQAIGLPTANFQTVVDFLTVQFLNSSQNATGGYLWDFGDGNTSTQASPVHIYTNDDYYEVTLTAFNACGETTLTQTVATGQFPLASFNAQFAGGCAPMVVQFFDQSGGTNLTGWAWEFEGGTPAFSNEQNPLVTYSLPGVFDVSLTVGNAVGENSTIEEGFVLVEEMPVAAFDFSVNELAAAFFNNSTGGTYLHWDFGDGQTSTMDSPLHVYDQGGLYNVVLTVANSACGSAIGQEVWIDVSGAGEELALPSANIYPNPTSDVLQIELTELPSQPTQLRLFDVNGQVLLNQKLTGMLTSLDVAALHTGLFILEISNENGRSYAKFVKE